MNDVATLSSPFDTFLAKESFIVENSELLNLQKAQFNAFRERGFPTRREERWKYTNVNYLAEQHFLWPNKNKPDLFAKPIANSIILVFQNGYFIPELSDIHLFPKEVVLCSLEQAFAENKNVFTPLLNHDTKFYPFASLNTAYMTDGMFLAIPDNVTLPYPIHCIHLQTQQNAFVTHPHWIIRVGKNSQLTMLEEYQGIQAKSYFTNCVTHMLAEENSHINYHKIQSESPEATHISHLFISQQRDSVVKSFSFALGGRLSREEISVKMLAPGAECFLHGFYDLKQKDQQADNYLYIHHAEPQGTSSMMYKGILNNKSRAVFNGKVHVYPDAQHINAHQANHNLLLSPEAEVNTKPELEIYADDVKCTHGATVGQIDSESLFYLQSRGIEKSEAIKLLTHAFADDILNKIENPDILQYVQQQVGSHVEL